MSDVQEVLEYLKSCLSSIICGSGYAHIKAGICWAVAHTINIIGVRINYYWPPPPAAKKDALLNTAYAGLGSFSPWTIRFEAKQPLSTF